MSFLRGIFLFVRAMLKRQSISSLTSRCQQQFAVLHKKLKRVAVASHPPQSRQKSPRMRVCSRYRSLLYLWLYRALSPADRKWQPANRGRTMAGAS